MTGLMFIKRSSKSFMIIMSGLMFIKRSSKSFMIIMSGLMLIKRSSKSFMIIMSGLMLIKRSSKSFLLILQNRPISAVFIEYEVLIGCFSRRSVMFVCLKSDINYYGNTLYNIY